MRDFFHAKLIEWLTAQAREVVEERLRQIALVAVLQHADRAWRLESRSPSAPRIIGTWPNWGSSAASARQIWIWRGVLLTWSSPRITCVIFMSRCRHHAEVVGRHAVGAQQHEIVELGIGEFDRSFTDRSMPRWLLRRPETHYRFLTRRRNRPRALARSGRQRPSYFGF